MRFILFSMVAAFWAASAHAQTIPVCGLFRGGFDTAANMIASPNPATSIPDSNAGCIQYCDASGGRYGDYCLRGGVTIKTYLAAPNVDIFLSPVGSDANSGLSTGLPVKTLTRALAIANAQRANQDCPITVNFLDGTYFGQQVSWTSSSERYETVFRPRSGITGSVILDGRTDALKTFGTKTYLLNFRLPSTETAGRPTNIIVKNLHVRYYFEAMTFSGLDRNEPNPVTIDNQTKAISKNSVIDSKFEKIGNRWAISLKSDGTPNEATAGIRLVNSHSNRFINNEFIDINNSDYAGSSQPATPTKGSALHAFYVAHNSSNNLFEGNSFVNHLSGSVIKVRDASNDNRILRNRFDQVSVPIQIWHCEPNETLVINGVSRLRGVRLATDDLTTGVDESTNQEGCTKNPIKNPPETYECLSFRTIESQNIYGKDGRTVLFSSSNLPFSIFSNQTYACNPSSTNIAFQRDSAVQNSGIIQKTVMSGNSYFGRCQASTDCVNSTNTCFAQGTGSSHTLCQSNTWLGCDLSSVTSAAGQTSQLLQGEAGASGYKACKPTEDGLDAIWTPVPANTFYVSSYTSSKWNYAFCSTSSSCVNSNSACYLSDTGSTHLWCYDKVWKFCGASTASQAWGSRTCTQVPLGTGIDYQWK